MRVAVLYMDGTREEFISVSTVIAHRGRKLLILIRNDEGSIPNSASPQPIPVSEINIPMANIRWWEVIQ